MAVEQYQEIFDAVTGGDIEGAKKLAERVIEKGEDPLDAIQQGYVPAIREMGARYQREEIFLPQMMAAAEAMKSSLELLDPEVKKRGEARETSGLIVIGTVENDIHDIGKNMVASLFSASGFQVEDLGVDVSCQDFIDCVQEKEADVLALSALLTTTMPEQRKVVETVSEESLKTKVLVGGAPVSREWAEEIGAHGFAEDAISAVALVKEMLDIN